MQDEPTSGLDARAAAIVIRSVKAVAESGRTVMVVVHQPSIDIFYAFDALLLLAKCAPLPTNGLTFDHVQLQKRFDCWDQPRDVDGVS